MRYEQITIEEFNKLLIGKLIKGKDLSNIDFTNVQFDKSIKFINCKFWQELDTSQGIIHMKGADFRNVNLNEAIFKNCDMRGVSMTQLQKDEHTRNCRFSPTEKSIKLEFSPANFISKILGDNFVVPHTYENYDLSKSVINQEDINNIEFNKINEVTKEIGSWSSSIPKNNTVSKSLLEKEQVENLQQLKQKSHTSARGA